MGALVDDKESESKSEAEAEEEDNSPEDTVTRSGRVSRALACIQIMRYWC